MKLFVTGASGWVGSAVVPELISAGHQVVGLARSEASATKLTAAGAEVHRGDLSDLDSLRSGAAQADGVIHLAFHHDFDNFVDAGELDRQAITALGETLEGSGRPLVVTSGTAGHAPGQLLTEDQPANPQSPRTSEPAALAFADRGVRVSIVRLAPTVHGDGDYGFIPVLIGVARAKGVSAYPGDGTNRWSAVHRDDAAVLFRLAAESAETGTILHAVGEQAVATRDIAENFGRHLDVPVTSIAPDAAFDHFGWIGAFFGIDMPASSAITQQRFGWQPINVGLLEDLDRHYFAAD
ncbi:SDR family oxidoreductase [Mycobacterium sp. shizuoka-1]|uniref:SDR family oxidoreductase n=1 Tax=Mycobacterium sp. shizuoka-1 TaxID=2039281 RepID=UPI000C0654F6|nr:SDR family oxidoreductase [Mycobacterium sp. shizuoka-1]GAY14584.1 putative NAD-dependent epimerase/dehydratase [Mycobacterium sp. shizuoka-1]